MNKKNLTRIISLVLVLCLLVPIIPDFGFDIVGVTAEAAGGTNDTLPTGNAAYFRVGSYQYRYVSTVYTATTAPVVYNGEVYLPSSSITGITAFKNYSITATQYAGSTIGVGGSANYIKISSVQSNTDKIASYSRYYLFATYDKIGDDYLICVRRGSSTGTALNFSDYSDRAEYSLMGLLPVDYTTAVSSLSHPYLFADQAEFDSLHAQWTEGSDPVLKGYLDYLVSSADVTYRQYANEDGSLNMTAGLVTDNQSSLDEMPYYTTGTNNFGYDIGGRQGASGTHTLNIASLAYAYQITRDVKYAQLALDYAVAISSWEHWGAGHFLNAADAAYGMALAYDWCYNIWGSIDSSKRNTVRDALFVKGVYAGAISSYSNNGSYLPWYNPVSDLTNGSGFLYNTRENNWNGVCSSGMIVAGLALIKETGSVSGLTLNRIISSGATSTQNTIGTFLVGSGALIYKESEGFADSYSSVCNWLINNNLNYLKAYGFKQYEGDGSYIESASYWSYGTNSIIRAMGALVNTQGSDYGINDLLNDTVKFSYHVQSSDGFAWGYHDSNGLTVDTSANAYYGAVTGDNTAIAYRKMLIENGNADPSFFDTFGYDANVDINTVDPLTLDYYMSGIQGYAVRDSWEPDGVYAAFMGGQYMVSHSQMDSGAFVYYNNGVRWFQDIGCDDYNVVEYGYGTQPSSFKYYPSSAEGNNTLCTDALLYGQYLYASADDSGVAEIVKHGEYGAAGSYAVLDQSEAFTGVASIARRGLLITNDRKTVVIQDEVTFNQGLTQVTESGTTSNPHTAYWFAHVLDSISITVSNDGKTAYLTDGDTIIRCSIVTGSGMDADAVFTVKDCAYMGKDSDYNPTVTNMVLGGTDKTGVYSKYNGGAVQKQYDHYQKLTVACTGVTNMQLAIVIEEVAPGDNFALGYTWQSMDSWGTSFEPTSNGNNYDGKVLLNKDFDQNGIGSFKSRSGNFRIANTLADGDNAMGVYATGSDGSSYIVLTAAPGKAEFGSIGNGMLAVELDVKRLQALTTSDGTLKLELYGTDVNPNISLDLKTLSTSLSGGWDRLTVIIDEQTDMLYVHINDTLVQSSSIRSRSYEDLRLVISSEGSFTAGKLLIDNALIRTFTEDYTALDAYISGGLTAWADKNREFVLTDGTNIAKLYNAEGSAGDTDPDSPIVDFWTSELEASETTTQASVASDVVFASSVSDLQSKINSGSYNRVELLRNLTTSISISKPMTVDTNGYIFYATSNNLICKVSGDMYTYEAGTIRVTYIVNGLVYYKDVTNSLPFEADVDSFVSDIREHKNADGSYTYTETKLGCWSNIDGGTPLESDDLVVTSANAKFYLTGEIYSGAFVVVESDGQITGYTDPYDLFWIALKKSNKRISITNDFSYDSTNDFSIQKYNSTSGNWEDVTCATGVNAGRICNNNVLGDSGTTATCRYCGVTYTLDLDGSYDNNSRIVSLVKGNSVNGAKTIFLNGYTVTYYSNTVSDHVFTVDSASLSVYGEGTFDLRATASNLILQAGNSASAWFEGIDLITVYNLTDIRKGTCTFKDCNLESKSQSYAFAVTNRSTDTSDDGNRDNGTTNPALMGILCIDGGTISYSGKASVFNVKDNSRLILKGGVTVIAPDSRGVITMEQSNGKDIAEASKDKDHVDHMRVYLGEVFFKATKVFWFVDAVNNSDGTAAQSDISALFTSKVFYIDGIGSVDGSLDYKYASSANGDTDVSYTVGEHVLARTGSSGYAWKVVPLANAAKVTWVGTTSIVEYWVEGSIPYAIGDVKSNLASGSAYNMYSLHGGRVEGGEEYTFSSVTKKNVKIKMSLTLNSDFTINFFVQKVDGINYIMVNGERVDITETTVIDGAEYYVIIIDDIAPENAADLFSIVVNFGDVHVTAVSSVLNYAAKLMGTTPSATTGGENITENLQRLMSAIVSYVGTSAAYSGDYFTEKSCQALVNTASFLHLKSDAELYASKPDTSSINGAIKSAYLHLGNSPAFAFRFREDFCGTVTISYKTFSGATVVNEVEVEYGIVTGTDSDVYTLYMKAYDMGAELTIAVDGASCKYGIDVYYSQAVQTNDELYRLLGALDVYTETARVYTKERHGVK